MHVLDYDGGLVDASCIAIIAALQHFRRPDVSVDGENVTIYTMDERTPVPLSILHHPICVSFSFFQDGEVVLLDATLREEQVREGELVITMNKFGELCQIAKMGGISVDPVTLLNCTQTALAKVKDITSTIAKKLESDALQRDVSGLIAEMSAENDR